MPPSYHPAPAPPAIPLAPARPDQARPQVPTQPPPVLPLPSKQVVVEEESAAASWMHPLLKPKSSKGASSAPKAKAAPQTLTLTLAGDSVPLTWTDGEVRRVQGSFERPAGCTVHPINALPTSTPSPPAPPSPSPPPHPTPHSV